VTTSVNQHGLMPNSTSSTLIYVKIVQGVLELMYNIFDIPVVD